MEYVIILELAILISIFSLIYVKMTKKLANLNSYKQILTNIEKFFNEYGAIKDEIQGFLSDFEDIKESYASIPEEIEAWKSEYLALKQDLLTLMSMPDDKIVNKIIPITDKLISHYMKNGTSNGMQIPPIRITGNKGIDGLIQMFVNNKLSNNPKPTSSTVESQDVKTNPFE